jgi:adenylylsulfate kinase
MKVVWITGLPGSGKSSIASLLTMDAIILDADNVRHGLNRDLGFSEADRSENIRRISEVARLIYDNGHNVVVAAISPFEADRQKARALFPPGDFVEVYLDCPVDVCKARGKPDHYFDVRYEVPSNPEVVLDTSKLSVEECVNAIFAFHRSLATVA